MHLKKKKTALNFSRRALKFSHSSTVFICYLFCRYCHRIKQIRSCRIIFTFHESRKGPCCVWFSHQNSLNDNKIMFDKSIKTEMWTLQAVQWHKEEQRLCGQTALTLLDLNKDQHVWKIYGLNWVRGRTARPAERQTTQTQANPALNQIHMLPSEASLRVRRDLSAPQQPPLPIPEKHASVSRRHHRQRRRVLADRHLHRGHLAVANTLSAFP